MFKPFILFALFFSLSTFALAQTTDSIIGKWKFNDIYHAEKMDSTAVYRLRKVFANMYIYLKANKHYTVFLFAKEEGTWQFDEATKKILMKANKGTENQMSIVAVSDKRLVLNIGKDKTLNLEKTSADASDEEEEMTYTGPLVSATKEQVSKKWYIVKRELPNRSDEAMKTVTDLIKGAYFDFKMNQTYTAEVLNLKDDGIWEFAEGNKSIITTSGSEKKYWQIKNITGNELVLVRGNTNEVWTLSVKP